MTDLEPRYGPTIEEITETHHRRLRVCRRKEQKEYENFLDRMMLEASEMYKNWANAR